MGNFSLTRININETKNFNEFSNQNFPMSYIYLSIAPWGILNESKVNGGSSAFITWHKSLLQSNKKREKKEWIKWKDLKAPYGCLNGEQKIEWKCEMKIYEFSQWEFRRKLKSKNKWNSLVRSVILLFYITCRSIRKLLSNSPI